MKYALCLKHARSRHLLFKVSSHAGTSPLPRGVPPTGDGMPDKYDGCGSRPVDTFVTGLGAHGRGGLGKPYPYVAELIKPLGPGDVQG